MSGLSALQRALMPVLDSYIDVQFSARRPGAVAEDLRQLMALHALNHVTKSRELILKVEILKKSAAQVR